MKRCELPEAGTQNTKGTKVMRTSAKRVLQFAGLGLALAALAGAAVAYALEFSNARNRAALCVGHLRNIGIGMKVYASDYAGKFPNSWLQASNEITSAAILVCPDDSIPSYKTDWQGLTETNFSYPYQGRGGGLHQTNRVLTVCPFHGHLLLGDAAVIRHRPGTPPLPTQPRDGALWWEGHASKLE